MNALQIEDFLQVLLDAEMLDGKLSGCFKADPSFSQCKSPKDVIENLTRMNQNERLKFDRYHIGNLIGRGGEGYVFEAHHECTKMPVALKVMNLDRSRSADFKERFTRTVQHIPEHPHVVRILDAGYNNDIPFVVMELLEGPDLKKWYLDNPQRDLATICDYLRRAALGLDYLHQKMIRHRDIKPANLILHEKELNVKIADIGACKRDFYATTGTQLPSLTGCKGAIMTLSYAHPELYNQNGKDPTPETDIWSLGLTLRYLVTGLEPKAGCFQYADPPWRFPELFSVFQGMCPDPKSNPNFRSACEVAEALRPFCHRPSKPHTTAAPTRPFTFVPGGKALAIGAHWDDIPLGCLGTLIRLSQIHDYEVTAIALCNDYKRDDNDTQHYYYKRAQPDLMSHIERIYSEIQKYGVKMLKAPLPDSFTIRNNKFADVESLIEEVIKKLVVSHGNCNVVMIPAMDDTHRDHALVSRLVFDTFGTIPHLTIMEYLIKAKCKGPDYKPNVVIDLDMKPEGNNDSVAEIVGSISRTISKVPGAFEYFQASAVKARMMKSINDLEIVSDCQMGEQFRTKIIT